MIEQHLQNIEKELEAIREKLNPYARITNAYWQDGKIVIEYENAEDILYGFGDKVFSVVENIGEIDLSGKIIIGIKKPDKDWWVQTNGGETVNVGPFQKEDEPDKISLKHVVWAWWDTMMPDESFDDFPFANGVKIDADNLSQAINSEAKYIIPFLGFRPSDLENDSTIRKRINGQAGDWKGQDLSKIATVILDDEPTYSKEIQENVVRVFQEEFPELSDKCTFSYSGNYIIAQRQLAQNLKHVHVNVYPFMEQGYSSFWGHIDSKEKFHEAFDRFIERLKSVSPDGVTFGITMQTFGMKYHGDADHEWKRLPPPPWSPIAYAEAMVRHGIKIGLSYLFKTKKNEDLIAKDMPELMKSVEKVYNSINLENTE